MAKDYIINGRKVKMWYTRGGARIPIYEDGGVGKNQNKKYDNYIKKGYTKKEIEDTLTYETQEDRMRKAGIEFASSEQTSSLQNKANKVVNNLKGKSLSQRAKEIDNANNNWKEQVKKNNDDNKSIKQLNEEMLGDKYKGKGQNPNLVYSEGRRIDIDANGNATVWKDGKIERKTRLPENVKGDKVKDYFDDNLKKLDDLKGKSLSQRAKKIDEINNNNWREQVKKNNETLNKTTTDIQNKINDYRTKSANSENGLESYQYLKEADRLQNEYYEKFRENERLNASIKKEVPTEKYEPVDAYAGYSEKAKRLSGDKYVNGEIVEYGNKSWTGKEYTNDEFMEHLTDSNWHSARKQLEEAGLTNQELSYIKDKTKLSMWGVEGMTTSKDVEKLINEAKNKYRQDISPMSEYSDTTGTGLSDRQSTSLAKMSVGELRDLANQYGLKSEGLSKKQLMAELISVFNK